MTTGTFVNTPGILFAFGQLIGVLFFLTQNRLRYDLKRTIITVLPFCALSALVGYLRNTPSYALFWPAYLLQFLIGTALLYATSQISVKKAAYFCIRGFILGEMATSLQWQINDYLLRRFPENAPHPSIVMVLCMVAIFIAAWFIESRRRTENIELQVSMRHLLSMIFIFFFTLSVANVSYLPIENPFRLDSSWDLFNLRTVAYFGGVGISIMYHLQILEFERRISAEKLQAITQMQYNNYKISEANIAVVNQKYHDLRHQLRWLRHDLDSEESKKAIAAMEHEIRGYEAKIETGNPVLDAILTGSARNAQEHEINLHCTANGRLIDFMSPVDISALFGNAVENAIEASAAIPDPEKRIVNVSITSQNAFVHIEISNYYLGDLKLRGGLPLTTKSDDRYHGFGVRSIRSVVERYEGSMNITTENGLYVLSILFLPAETIEQQTS